MKTLSKILCSLIFLVFVINFTNAQDLHFSKAYDAPLILNPANTGNYSGNWRLINNYRQQGDKAAPYYTTSTIAFDRPVYIRNEKMSLGLIYIHDNSAEFSFFSNKVYLSAAYFIKTTQKSYLHMGFQGGYVLKNLNENSLTFPEQFDMGTGQFNSQLYSGESFENYSTNYADFNYGIVYSYVSESYKIEMGTAGFHFNRPNEAFFNKKNQLKIKQVTHFYYQRKLAEKYYIKPILLYAFQNKASEMLTGTIMGVRLNHEHVSELSLGVLYRGGFMRTQDAIIGKLGFNYNSFTISMAFDVEATQKKGLAYTGNAFELSVSFNRAATDLRSTNIKCEIF